MFSGYNACMAYNKLTDKEKRVIEGEGTEEPFTGEYNKFFEDGTYICRRCNSPIFLSKTKFDPGTGWPSFDDNIEGAVKRKQDPDGRRIMILCSNCGAHLGHVFEGENYTKKNTRHCANSLSLRFIPQGKKLPKVLKS